LRGNQACSGTLRAVLKKRRCGRVVPPQPVFAFCGNRNPDAFFSDLQNGELKLSAKSVSGPSPLYRHDVKTLERMRSKRGAKALLTGKRYTELQELGFASCRWIVQDAIETRDGEALCALIRKKIAVAPTELRREAAYPSDKLIGRKTRLPHRV